MQCLTFDLFCLSAATTRKCARVPLSLSLVSVLSTCSALIIGTSSICDEHSHEPLLANLSLLVETATRLRRNGHRVVIVSSGGIAMGLRRLDLPKRPKVLAAVQAIAAVGQCRLIALWDDLFRQLRQPVAQILLTRNDIADVCCTFA